MRFRDEEFVSTDGVWQNSCPCERIALQGNALAHPVAAARTPCHGNVSAAVNMTTLMEGRACSSASQTQKGRAPGGA
jgi:hypothetical protein